MARKPATNSVNTRSPAPEVKSSAGNSLAAPSKIKVKTITPLEAHYMKQLNTAFSYISGVSEKNIAVVVLDSYLDEDSLLSFASKYFQSLFKPGKSTYLGDYFQYNGNNIQFASITNTPKLENYLLFTVGSSLEYTSELDIWVKSGKYMNQVGFDDPIVLN
jgi:hypothetical protein